MRNGVTVTVAVLVTPFALAPIVTVRGAGASVVTIDTDAVFPATVTEAGTGAAASLDVSKTTVPGAAAVNGIVPTTVAPEATSLALSVSDDGIGGVTVSV